MDQRERWSRVLALEISACIELVQQGRAVDADPVIDVEETLGEEEARRLWSDPELGAVAQFLEFYCFDAEHDRDLVYDEVPIEEARHLLLECKQLLEEGRYDFPEKIGIVRGGSPES